MNSLLLFIALHRVPLPAWIPAGPGFSIGLLTRFIAAVSILAIEMQIATWTGVATIRSLALFNLLVAVAIVLAVKRRKVAPVGYAVASFAPYLWVLGLVAALVVVLNVARPIEAADPYHLQRMAQIERLGTLAYDLSATPKINALGWTYELLLADIDQIPLVGHALLRVHGLFGLALYVLAIAVARRWLSGGRLWWTHGAVLLVPVVFHQFVLIKNDLFGAVPALVVLAWLVGRAHEAEPREVGWASWLAGFAVGVKLTSAPLAIVMAGAILFRALTGRPEGRPLRLELFRSFTGRPEGRPLRLQRGRTIGALVVGATLGVACAGLGFTLIENARWYGNPIEPFERAGGLDNRNATVAQAAVSVGRFAISLFDLGLVTRRVWPGRGGWGATFGLPFVWALALLALRYGQSVEARRALWIAGAYFLIFAAVYTDADLAHRLALAPGVLLIVVAIHLSDGDDRASRWMRHALAGVMVLSAMQILRSAALYLRS